MLKIVLDTNILIDAIFDKSSFAWKILELSNSENIKFFATPNILKEYEFIIEQQVMNKNDRRVLQDFISKIEIVKETKKVKIVKWDREDDKFINAALSLGADYVISSDSHLLELSEYGGIKILGPKGFYYEFKGTEDSNGEKEWQDVFTGLFR